VGTSPGCGEVTPLVGTSPAETDAESTNAKAILAKNRFIILFAPLVKMQDFFYRRRLNQYLEVVASCEKQHEENFAKVRRAPPNA
jgi:hypothetical protein